MLLNDEVSGKVKTDPVRKRRAAGSTSVLHRSHRSRAARSESPAASSAFSQPAARRAAATERTDCRLSDRRLCPSALRNATHSKSPAELSMLQISVSLERVLLSRRHASPFDLNLLTFTMKLALI